MLFVPAVFFVLSLATRLRWATVARGLVVYGALGLVILPWSVRNHEVFGRPVFIVTSGGINLLIGNNPVATGGYGPADPVSEAAVEAEKDEGAREIVARTIALRHIREHPWRTIGLVPFRLWHLYAKDVEGFYWNELAGGAEGWPLAGRPMLLVKLLAELYYLALLAMFAAGIFSFYLNGRVPFPRPFRSALGLGLVAHFTLVMMLLFGSSRLHFPLVPCFAWYAGAWLAARVTATEPVRQRAGSPAHAWSWSAPS